MSTSFESDQLRFQVWSTPTNTTVTTTPAVSPDGSRVFVTTSSGLICLSALSGSIRWTISVGSPMFSTPLVLVRSEAADSNSVSQYSIYAGANNFRLYSINQTGGIEWSTAVAGPVRSVSGSASRGIVFAGVQYPGRSVFAVNLTDGSIMWEAGACSARVMSIQVH